MIALHITIVYKKFYYKFEMIYWNEVKKEIQKL
jgi:hypothetical protein